MKKFDWKEVAGLEKSYYSDRVILRPLLECDVYPIFMATTNPAFNKYLLWDAPSSVPHLAERIDRILDERRKGQMGVWVAAEITTGAFVALFRANAADPLGVVDELHIETGIWLHPNYWSDGLSVEIGFLLMELLFSETPAVMIRAETHVKNMASKGLFRAVGLEYVKNLDVSHENGMPSPSELYQISRDKYKIKGLSRNGYMDIKATIEARKNRFDDQNLLLKSSEDNLKV